MVRRSRRRGILSARCTGKVFVTVADYNDSQTSLYALDVNTGAIIWGPVALPTDYYQGASAAYENGTLFVVPPYTSDFSSGAMDAYDAVTGRHKWSTILPDQYSFSSPPTALNGY